MTRSVSRQIAGFFMTTKTSPLKLVDKQSHHDRRHEFIGVVDAFTPAEGQREGQGVSEVLGRRWREMIGGARATAAMTRIHTAETFQGSPKALGQRDWNAF